MCGLAGFLCKPSATASKSGEIIRTMTDTLAHRGPDAGTEWLDEDVCVAFGHRRLSIVDLSPAGAQPMHSTDGRWVIIYNGELYNTEDLRSEVVQGGYSGHWRGHSDTEVMLEAVSLWGVERAVKKFNGIFAFALWDRRERRLWLVRDRLGVKPLYWTQLADGTFMFGSELRALRRHPKCPTQIDHQAVAAFLHSACVPSPLTIYRGIHKLMPAHILSVSPDGAPTTACYWDIRAISIDGQHHLDQRPDEELTDELEQLLLDAVGRQMVADVPLGAFLSGGIDSSTVVALMQAQSNQPVRTFSIGFKEKKYSEADHAQRVAAHLQTQHTELIVEAETTRATIARLPDIYDEPFADSSQIPTFLVSQLARRDVTVALSGDGGDECFAGYTRYQWIECLANWTRVIPQPILRGTKSALQALSIETWDCLLSPIPARLRPTHIGDKIHKGSALLPLAGVEAMYSGAVAQWSEPHKAMRDHGAGPVAFGYPDLSDSVKDPVARMRYLDMTHYLPNDILTKLDRASMAVSLEARVPLLDHRVVEYSWRLPRSALTNGRIGKRILRNVLRRYVPPALFERQKMGFGIPLGEWIRGPLAEWAADLLSEHSLKTSGLFDVAYVRRHLDEHLTGRRNWQYALWTIIMFQAWYRRWA
jgi:asparagine synthase (glutamine-hydrolysing)